MELKVYEFTREVSIGMTLNVFSGDRLIQVGPETYKYMGKTRSLERKFRDTFIHNLLQKEWLMDVTEMPKFVETKILEVPDILENLFGVDFVEMGIETPPKKKKDVVKPEKAKKAEKPKKATPKGKPAPPPEKPKRIKGVEDKLVTPASLEPVSPVLEAALGTERDMDQKADEVISRIKKVTRKH